MAVIATHMKGVRTVSVQSKLCSQAESRCIVGRKGQVHTKIKSFRDNFQALLSDLGINQLVRLSSNFQMPGNQMCSFSEAAGMAYAQVDMSADRLCHEEATFGHLTYS